MSHPPIQVFGNAHPFTTDTDISSGGFWRQTFRDRDLAFAGLRESAPVSWHPPLSDEQTAPHEEAGFWAVVRIEDIRTVSLDNATFGSALGGTSLRPRSADGGPSQALASFLNMDPPEHTRYRKIFSAAFTPKAVARLNDQIHGRARAVTQRVLGAGEVDLVQEVAAKLPMMTVADLIGIPESQVETFAKAGDNIVSIGHSGVVPDGRPIEEFLTEQLMTLIGIGSEVVAYRKDHPADDVATALANTTFDGRHLTIEEIGGVMVLMCVAGNDTTKQTTSWTFKALADNPDQRRWLAEDVPDRLPKAVEEFVRFASPVIQFGRTATRDVQLGGQQIAAGDKVVMFYCSGNRDESVFDDPHAFNLQRDTAGHVAFGGGGVHYCLGHNIAKAQLRALFTELLTTLPTFELAGEPDFLASEFINGIRRLPVRL